MKPGSWIGIQSGAIIKTLVGSKENKEVLIAFGYDAPTNFIFITHADLKKLDIEEVLQEAYTNISDYSLEFEPVSSFNGKILTCSGKDFSSEKILCDDFMLKAHEMLQADEILVSIPRRRCMMVIARNATAELVNTFIQLHNAAWNDASYGNPEITNLLFILKNGEIVSTASIQG